MFKYPEDKIPITLFVIFFLADLLAYLFIDNLWILGLWALLGIVPKGFICAWNHHHQHCYTFKSALLNRLLELIYFFQTGACGYGWELHHVVGHHAQYLDQTADPSRWKTHDGRTMGELEYTLKTAVTAYPRVIPLGLKHRRLLTGFLASAILALLSLSALIYWRPIPAILLFVIPPITSLLITVWTTYAHHSGLETDNAYAASRNIIDPVYNRLTGNLGYHTAHHVRCALHWSKLPELHKEIKERIPPSCYYEPGGALALLRKFDKQSENIDTQTITTPSETR